MQKDSPKDLNAIPNKTHCQKIIDLMDKKNKYLRDMYPEEFI